MDCFSKLKNTIEGTELENIPDLPNVCSFPDKIKKWFQFWVQIQGQIWCRTTYECEDWVMQQISVVDEISKMTKQKLTEYLRNENIQFAETALKAELVVLVRYHKFCKYYNFV